MDDFRSVSAKCRRCQRVAFALAKRLCLRYYANDNEQDFYRYKSKPDVGGNIKDRDHPKSNCSWVSIKRINGSPSNPQCQEMVCIFMGNGKSSIAISRRFNKEQGFKSPTV
ncbi:MAG: hypothetical protein LH613_14660 [Chamaesiphon sp.]|nr:hypothetical protein [Chamaesiphon sp.]